MNRIDKKFKELKRARKKAFIAFITAGYPNLKATEQLLLKFSSIGVDIVELGVPFSDPMADGPVIQEASEKALKNKVHLEDILKLVRRARQKTELPLCLMTYYNPVFCFGEQKFVRQAKQAGVDGVIIPDLPPEEAKGLISLARKSGLAIVFFISPTTSMQRARHIAGVSRGFIYYVSLTGVTGARQKLPAELTGHLKKIKKITPKPLCVGFGIAHPGQVREIYKFADGVIVGSAIVKKIKENLKRKNLVQKVADFVECLLDAV